MSHLPYRTIYLDDKIKNTYGGTSLLLANTFLENYVRPFCKHKGHCRAGRFALTNTWPKAGSMLQVLA
jgi:hypothetical protein